MRRSHVPVHPEQATRRIWLAGAAATAISLACGVGFRAFEARLARAAPPLPPGTLATLPMEIGEWSGRDIPLAPEIVKRTDTDDHISRGYSRKGGDPIGLWVAFGTRARDLMPHRPEVCYPGAGWTLQEAAKVELPAGDGLSLQGRLQRFRRGAFNAQEIVVLNYYVIDGKYYPDVSVLRTRNWWSGGLVKYMAQVQITCTGTAVNDSSRRNESVRDFAIASARAILAVLTGAGELQPAGAPGA